MKKSTYKRPPRKHFSKKSKHFGPSRIKPGADSRLNRIFEKIGIPKDRPFEPDRFQLEALAAVEHADCLVTAPTGAGKTWIAETAIAKIHQKNGKAWYASPLKALSNAIYAKFCEKFGNEQVGILTGDRKENPGAPIVVGTTEILRNHLYDAMHQGEDLATDFVVLDEAHFLGDEDRGVVWEEIMIYLPNRIPLLMLSATVGNANQIAGWLESIRRKKCIVVREDRRPVPLYPLFFHPAGTLYPLIVEKGQDKKAVLYKKVLAAIQSRNAPTLSRPGKLPPMGDIIRVLRKYRLLPAIFFMKSRADCDSSLDLCTEESLLNNPERKATLSSRIQSLVAGSPHLSKHKQLWQLEHLAVGSHHSGQLPAWKIVIENLMTEGLLDAVFATSTVAAGVNFPARSVIILNSDRFNGVDFQPLNPTEFHQMTGRAGRRGMDQIGFAMMLPGKFMDLRHVAKLIQASPSDVYSQIKINFSMVLNLLMSHTPQQIQTLLQKSFAAYLRAKLKGKKGQMVFFEDRDYLWRDFQQHLDFLKENDYVDSNDKLTEDGVWASRLRIDQPLLVAEGFRKDLFSGNDPALLAAVIASFVSDRDTEDDNLSGKEIPKKLLNRFLTIKRVLRPFTKNMISRGFGTKALSILPANTMFAWASGRPWEDVLLLSEQNEGDLARLILRTADNLRHIGNLAEIFPAVAAAARESIDAILREPIVSYYE